MARKSIRSDDVTVKPPSDAYTGLLALSLIAMIASCVVLYLDYAQYGNTKAPAPVVPAVSKPTTVGALAAPNMLAAIASEPLPVPALPLPSAIVPVNVEIPVTGPELTPPE